MSSALNPTDSQLKHVAIIMDGNSRWARQRSLQALAGHQVGAERLEEVLQVCKEKQIQYLTVFAFSSENWSRPSKEVGGLMSLLASALKRNRKRMKDEGIELKVIGRRDRLSKRLQTLIQQVEQDTSGGESRLTLAIDYGGRWDIAQAAKAVAEKVVRGEIHPDLIDEDVISENVCMSDIPDPDLLIRTGYESRISNFLLWQLSYSELFFASCYWPDFDRAWFEKAIQDYQSRNRRFGASSSTVNLVQEAKSA